MVILEMKFGENASGIMEEIADHSKGALLL